jgi:hypothetical protein
MVKNIQVIFGKGTIKGQKRKKTPTLTHIPLKKQSFFSSTVGVFCTGKNRVVKIARSSSEMVIRTIKHTMIYPGPGSSLEVIALRPAV